MCNQEAATKVKDLLDGYIFPNSELKTFEWNCQVR